MATWKFSLLLPLTLTLALSQEGEVQQQQLVMRAGSDEVIPLCTDDSIVLVWCWIRAETEHGEECRLYYRDNGDFNSSCTSRFTLQTHNHTVSLHLSNLTPEDSGNHTCQCSFAVGIQHLHLNLTVIGDPLSSVSLPARPLVLGIGIAACSLTIILIAGVLLLLVWLKSHQRRRRERQCYYMDLEMRNADPSFTYFQKENEIYST